MFKKYVSSLTAWLLTITLFLSGTSLSQKVSINASDFKQTYEGGGISYGLYKGHHWSMSTSNQEKFMKMMYGDVNMKYIQYYAKTHPKLDSTEFDRVARYVLDARKHRDDLEVVIVVDKYPSDMTVVRNVDHNNDGTPTDEEVLNVDDPEVYDKVAEWMFEIMEYLHKKGVQVDIFSMANEPDFWGRFVYGAPDAKDGLGLVVQNSVPKLKELVRDSTRNVDDLKMPQILAPSGIAPGGSLNFINHWIENYPIAYENLDIIGTHQYIGGSNWRTLKDLSNKLEGRRFFQTEQHTNKGDGLGSLNIEPFHRGVLSLHDMFAAAINNGVESWFYFVPNYPNTYHNGGLFQVAWGGSPKPYKTYYGFKQLHMQPKYSKRLTRTGINGANTSVFRRPDQDIIYLHVSNNTGVEKEIDIEVISDGLRHGIKSIKAWQTDDVMDIEQVLDKEYDVNQKIVNYTLPSYSLLTFRMDVDMSPTFLNAHRLDDGRVILTWNDNSGTEEGYLIERKEEGADFEVISKLPVPNATAFADIQADTNKSYTYKIRSYKGDYRSNYSNEVKESTEIKKSLQNVALGKLVDVDSEPNSTYPGANAVDGDNESNSSRWFSGNGLFPHWISVGLGESIEIEKVQFWTGFDGYKNPISDFQFQHWDGAKWVDIFSEQGNQSAEYSRAFTPVKTDSVRLYMTAAADNTVKLYELEVYSLQELIELDTLKPLAPSKLVVDTLSHYQAKLSWNDTSDNEYGFVIDRKILGKKYEAIDTLAENVTQYTDESLFQGSSYSYRVRAYNGAGASLNNKEVQLTTPTKNLVAPNNLFAMPKTYKSVELTWQDMSDNEYSFRIERKDQSSNAYELIGEVAANQTTFVDTLVSPETTYFYRVLAFHFGVEKSYSDEKSATTPIRIVTAPTMLMVNHTSNFDKVSLSWNDNDNDEQGYKIERKDSVSGEFKEIVILPANSKSYIDEQLNEVRSYAYRVKAYDGELNSDYSNSATIVTLPKPVKTPSFFTFSEITEDKVALKWFDNSDNELGFQLARKSDEDSVFVIVKIIDANLTNYKDSALNPNTTYTYRIWAFSEHNQSDTVELTLKTQKIELKAPLDFTSPASSESEISLSWVKNTGREEGFIVERKGPSDTLFIVLDSLERDMLIFLDSGLEQETIYQYRIKSFNGSFESPYSDTLAVLTKKTPEVLSVMDKLKFRVFPTPFDRELEFRYSLQKPGLVQISLISTNGSENEVLLNDHKSIGLHEFFWASESLKSGIYILRFSSPESDPVHLRVIKVGK